MARQRGAVTLLGAMIVLVIFSIALAGALAFAAELRASAKIADGVNAFMVFENRLSNAYADSYSVGRLSNAVAIDKGFVPEVMQIPERPGKCNECIGVNKLPDGSAWGVRADPLLDMFFGGNQTAYVLIIVPASRAACVAYTQMFRDRLRPHQMAIGTMMSAPLAPDVSNTEIVEACSPASARTGVKVYGLY